MYEYIRGKVIEVNPAQVVIEVSGIAYLIHISLNTYSILAKSSEAILFVHQVVREDAHLLFGFRDKKEREIFRLLISVSGIGANTARLILSSLSPSEIEKAIISADVRTLQNIKGIGQKTAQRLIVDLGSKFGKLTGTSEIFNLKSNTVREESLSALVNLGFSKLAAEKVLDRITGQYKEAELSLEDLIKKALKEL
jgi:holliday junction DNA helicase RuvA